MICIWPVDMSLLDFVRVTCRVLVYKIIKYSLVLILCFLGCLWPTYLQKLKVSLSGIQAAISLQSCIAIYDSVQSLIDL
jgi:hypothetical protein